MDEITIADIRGAVARGWTWPDNSHKDMDLDLAEAISREIATLFSIKAVDVSQTGDPMIDGSDGISNPRTEE